MLAQLPSLILVTAVFSKVLALAPAANLRFVAITRRDYDGSTPLTAEELEVLSSGSDTDKASFLQDRAAEFATFVSTFIQNNNIPPPTADGKNGGVALLGWSQGNAFSIATVANVQIYPKTVKDSLAGYLRALIMQGMHTLFHAQTCVLTRNPT